MAQRPAPVNDRQADPIRLRAAMQRALERQPVTKIIPVLGWQPAPARATVSSVLRLTMVLTGTRHVRVPQPGKPQVVAMEAGNILVVAPNAWSRPRIHAGHRVLNIDCYPTFTRFVLNSIRMPVTDHDEGIFHSDNPMKPATRYLLQALAALIETQDAERIRPVLNCFFGEILSECTPWQSTVSGLSDWQRAVSLMHDDHDVALDRESVAQSIGIHPNHLSRLCKRFTKSSFSEFITNLRMNRACNYLRQGLFTVQEVARLSGYHDETHFRKRFKQVFGQTPSQWAREANTWPMSL